jgi:hypothetical protein
MQLIVIAGKARVGKTTLANIIAEKSFELGFIPKLMSFATALKGMAKDKGLSKEDNPEEYRKFCQEVGADKRDEDPNYWVDILEEGLLSELKAEGKDCVTNKKYWERCVIIDDCRYLNEIEMANDYNPTLLFLTSKSREIPNSDDEWRKHHSEDLANQVEKGEARYKEIFDHIISNDKQTEDLKKSIGAALPMWITSTKTLESAECQCEGCRSSREGRMMDMNRCIQELTDLLFYFDPDDDEDGEDCNEET